ncbi:DUF4340 domain-containing protein [candidate division KSB1 bacterium]|nr:DUF4340 domain-containing protein [candidate division KSB1 bacterium]
MTEIKKTIIWAGAALAVALLAFITKPGTPQPEAFYDKGETFFPDFQDPNAAASLEVIEYNEDTGSAVPFKVENKNGVWTIPSHHNYPADGKDRLAKTAAGVIGITKDDFRSDAVADRIPCGVVDPLDETEASMAGRGKRVTLRGHNGEVLADFIIGKEIDGADNYRFVRIPEQKRIYAVKMDIDLSTNFVDWIEKDLLEVDKEKLNKVVLKDYSINESTGVVDQRDEVVLTKEGSNWKTNKLNADQEMNTSKVNEFMTALDGLNIVGVRPKPEGLSASLSKDTGAGVSITQSDVMSLQSKGYYFSRDGQLLSNEGELSASTSDGVEYTLRFGEIVYGSGDDVSAGSAEEDTNSGGPGENRYLFISARFLPGMFPEPAKPANMEYQTKADSLWGAEDHENKSLNDEHEKWQQKVDKGKETAEELNRRFAEWYYVISSDSFGKLHKTRSDFVKKKEEDKK